MPRIVTWNMEGGTYSQESKWHTGVQQLLGPKIDADVLCLQEAGPLPPTAVPYAGPMPAWLGPPPPLGVNWSLSTWQPGVTPYCILWLQTDPNGNRVNLAIVMPQVPANLIYANPGLPGGRPALGVQRMALNIFTLHGFSGNGNDTPGLLNNIQGMLPPGSAWVAAGDYNREPATWAPPVGSLCPPNGFTRWPSKRKLDYEVRSAPVINGIVIDSLVLSDHFPVVYG